MHKIAAKLIEYGMDFQYENNGSQGEQIVSYEPGIEVTIQKGKIWFEYRGETYKENNNETSIDILVSLLENALIQETT